MERGTTTNAGTATGAVPLRSAWPAYVSAASFGIYAAMKATYAVQGKLGLPIVGREVPAAAYEVGYVALRQWTLAGLGLATALIALASVRGWGRRIPRWLLLSAMWAVFLPSLAAVPFVVERVADDSESAGYRLFVAVQSAVGLSLWAAATLGYQRRSRRRPTEPA